MVTHTHYILCARMCSHVPQQSSPFYYLGDRSAGDLDPFAISGRA